MSPAFEFQQLQQRELQTDWQLQALSQRLHEVIAAATHVDSTEPSHTAVQSQEVQTAIVVQDNVIAITEFREGQSDRHDEFRLPSNFVIDLAATDDTGLPVVIVTLTKHEPVGTVPWLRIVAATHHAVYQRDLP